MRRSNQLGRLHAVITLIVPRGAAAAAAACSPVNRVNITYLYLYFLLIMSCQLTLFLAFLLQRWLRWLHVLARKPRKFGAQLFKGFISSQRQRIWTMSLITGYDGILDTRIHAAALLLIGQNIATSAKQRMPPFKADLQLVVLVCQFRLKRPIWRYAWLILAAECCQNYIVM